MVCHKTTMRNNCKLRTSKCAWSITHCRNATLNFFGSKANRKTIWSTKGMGNWCAVLMHPFDQTFSCGFSCPECGGHPGSTDTPPSFISALAHGFTNNASPSNRIWNFLLPEKLRFRNGMTFLFKSMAHCSPVLGLSTRKFKDFPFEVVMPKSHCFLTNFQSFLANHFLGLWNLGSFLSAFVIIVLLALNLWNLACNFLG